MFLPHLFILNVGRDRLTSVFIFEMVFPGISKRCEAYTHVSVPYQRMCLEIKSRNEKKFGFEMDDQKVGVGGGGRGGGGG